MKRVKGFGPSRARKLAEAGILFPELLLDIEGEGGARGLGKTASKDALTPAQSRIAMGHLRARFDPVRGAAQSPRARRPLESDKEETESAGQEQEGDAAALAWGSGEEKTAQPAEREEQDLVQGRWGSAGGAESAGEEEQQEREQEGQVAAESLWRQRLLHAATLLRGSSARWEANLTALRAYTEESGGRQPGLSSSACAEERRLANWCNNKRAVRDGTQAGALSAAQVQQLEHVRGWS